LWFFTLQWSLCSPNLKMDIHQLTGLLLHTGIRIHKQMGPGCYEKVYEESLCHELQTRGIRVDRQLLLPIRYEELFIPNAYRVDLLIENQLVVEIKTLARVAPVHFIQVQTYLRMMNLKNGVLMNFNVPKLKNGFHRIFNNLAT
jgi:GxxExxY protein